MRHGCGEHAAAPLPGSTRPWSARLPLCRCLTMTAPFHAYAKQAGAGPMYTVSPRSKCLRSTPQNGPEYLLRGTQFLHLQIREAGRSVDLSAVLRLMQFGPNQSARSGVPCQCVSAGLSATVCPIRGGHGCALSLWGAFLPALPRGLRDGAQPWGVVRANACSCGRETPADLQPVPWCVVGGYCSGVNLMVRSF